MISNMEGRSGAPEAAPERTKNPARNEKDRERRRVGGARHAKALADKQAEIDHLRGSLTGVLGQMENFKGVADIYHPRLPEVNRALGRQRARTGFHDGIYDLIRDPSGDGDCAAYGNLQENGLRASRERDCPFACADQSSRGARATARRSKLLRPKRLISRPRSLTKRRSMMKITKVFGAYTARGWTRTCSSTSR